MRQRLCLLSSGCRATDEIRSRSFACLGEFVETLQSIESFKTAVRPSKEGRARLNLEGAADGRGVARRGDSASLRRSIESEYRT